MKHSACLTVFAMLFLLPCLAEDATWGSISITTPTFVWNRATDDLTVNIPVCFSVSTNTRRTVRWKAVDGTARLGTDFTQSNGERVVAGTSSTSTSFEIYLKPNTGDRSLKYFTVELTGGDGVTVDEYAYKTTIYLVDGGEMFSVTDTVIGLFPSPILLFEQLFQTYYELRLDPRQL